MGEKLVSVPEKPELQAPVYDGGGMGESGSVCTGGAGEQDKGALGGRRGRPQSIIHASNEHLINSTFSIIIHRMIKGNR